MACSNHFFNKLGFSTLDIREGVLKSNLLIYLIIMQEPNSLIESHRGFEFILRFDLHSLMLESISLHLFKRLILLSSLSLHVHSLFDSINCLNKLGPRNFSISIHIKFFHKKINLSLDWREPIGFE